MKYLRGSFSVGPSLGADEQTVADNWERTFGKPRGVPDQQEPAEPWTEEMSRSEMESEICRLRGIIRNVGQWLDGEPGVLDCHVARLRRLLAGEPL